MLNSRLMVGVVAPVLALGLLTFSPTLWSAADHPVAEAHAYQGWSAGRPQVSTLATSNDGQAAAAFGAVADLEPTPTPSSTPPPEWRLVIDGFVQSPLNLTFDDLVAMPISQVPAGLYCVGRPKNLIVDSNWTGVRLGLLLQEAGVSPEAVKVGFYASDGYSTDLTVTTALRSDVIVAYEEDGQPLPEGGVRLVVPGKWGYKWIKWLTHIELFNYDFLGKSESAGYSDEADIPGYGTTVGGIQALPDEPNAPRTAATSSSGTSSAWAAVAGVVAGAAILGAGLSYARRRWHNPPSN